MSCSSFNSPEPSVEGTLKTSNFSDAISSLVTHSTSSSEFVQSIFETIKQTSGYRPSWDEYFMAMAALIGSRSVCGRLHVGCVIVSSAGDEANRVIAAGYNGFLPNLPHISRVRDDHEQAIVHAEQNAITDAARRGVSVNGATAYITHFPCINCTKILLAAGIKVIKYHDDYKNDPIVYDILNQAKIAVFQL